MSSSTTALQSSSDGHTKSTMAIITNSNNTNSAQPVGVLQSTPQDVEKALAANRLARGGQAYLTRTPRMRTHEVPVNRLCTYGAHSVQWIVVPERVLRQEYWLDNNQTRRADMSRIYNMDFQARVRLWARRVAFGIWFQIPQEIPVGRTFCRDEWDVVYLDHMHYLVQLASTVDPRLQNSDLPLFYLRLQLLGRRWNIWDQLPFIIRATEVWHAGGIFAPHDALDLDVSMSQIAMLREIYPEVPTWYDIQYFPAGVLCFAPLVLYYYYDRIRVATGAEKRFWDYILRAEFALIFTASWWNQAERGQKAYIIPSETIDWLEQYLELDMPIDAETANSTGGFTAVGWVLERMRDVQDAPSHLVHVVMFRGTTLPNSYFVLAKRGTCYMDADADDGLPWYCSPADGRMYIDVDRMEGANDVRAGDYRRARSDTELQWQGAQRLARRRADRNRRMHAVREGRVENRVRPSRHHPIRRYDLPDDAIDERPSNPPPPSPRVEPAPPALQTAFQPQRQPPLIGPSGSSSAPIFPPPPPPQRSHNRPAGSTLHQVLQRAVEGDGRARQTLQQAFDFMQNARYNVERQAEAYQRHQRTTPAPSSQNTSPAGLFSTAPIPRGNSTFAHRPFQHWNQESLRAYVRMLLQRNGNQNPSQGEINALANMLANMRGYEQ